MFHKENLFKRSKYFAVSAKQVHFFVNGNKVKNIYFAYLVGEKVFFRQEIGRH